MDRSDLIRKHNKGHSDHVDSELRAGNNTCDANRKNLCKKSRSRMREAQNAE